MVAKTTSTLCLRFPLDHLLKLLQTEEIPFRIHCQNCFYRTWVNLSNIQILTYSKMSPSYKITSEKPDCPKTCRLLVKQSLLSGSNQDQYPMDQCSVLLLGRMYRLQPFKIRNNSLISLRDFSFRTKIWPNSQMSTFSGYNSKNHQYITLDILPAFSLHSVSGKWLSLIRRTNTRYQW
jgi:hypothetical protein